MKAIYVLSLFPLSTDGLRRTPCRRGVVIRIGAAALSLIAAAHSSPPVKAGGLFCAVMPTGSPCPDTDGNECTAARCDGGQNCVQDALILVGDSCADTDDNICTRAQCDVFAQCDQNASLPSGPQCGDIDDNGCTIARCDGLGGCDQLGSVRTGAECPDTDDNECTEARCAAAGNCDQNGFFPNGPSCVDIDDNTCTVARCDGLGSCDQLGTIRTGAGCPDVDDNECTEARCAAAGNCDQNGFLPSGPSCADTDENSCTFARCDGLGACDQLGTIRTGAGCPDVDKNECTEARCDAQGDCDQAAVSNTGHNCEDTDGNTCTDARCDATGGCDQLGLIRSGAPCADTDGLACTIAACAADGACDQFAECTDTTSPEITCPPAANIVCGEAADSGATGEATATDDCDPDPALNHSDTVIPTTNPADAVQEVVHRTWTATNDCGLSSECVQVIEVLKVEAFLDIKPGSCPNPLNLSERGLIPMSLLGTGDFDVATVDATSIRLSRADGIGGVVKPSSWVFRDTGTPFAGPLCGCHRFNGDRIVDLSLKFDNQTIVSAMQLNTVAAGASIRLIVTGTLSDGCKFIAGDCMRRTPR